MKEIKKYQSIDGKIYDTAEACIEADKKANAEKEKTQKSQEAEAAWKASQQELASKIKTAKEQYRVAMEKQEVVYREALKERKEYLDKIRTLQKEYRDNQIKHENISDPDYQDICEFLHHLFG